MVTVDVGSALVWVVVEVWAALRFPMTRKEARRPTTTAMAMIPTTGNTAFLELPNFRLDICYSEGGWGVCKYYPLSEKLPKSLGNPCKNAMPDLQIRESSRKGDNRRRTCFTGYWQF